MTNANRFAIYLRFFHPRDLWSWGDQHLCWKDLEFSVTPGDPGQTEAVLSIILTTMNQWENIWAPSAIYLSCGGREAGGGEGDLAVHLRPGQGDLDGDLVQVSLAIQGLVQRTTGLGQTCLQTEKRDWVTENSQLLRVYDNLRGALKLSMKNIFCFDPKQTKTDSHS